MLIIKTAAEASITDEKLDAIALSIKSLSKKIEASKPTLPEMSYRDALQPKTEAMIRMLRKILVI